jgi:hypothetical protein
MAEINNEDDDGVKQKLELLLKLSFDAAMLGMNVSGCFHELA